MPETSEKINVGDDFNNHETEKKIDLALDEIKKWGKEDKEIREEMSSYRSSVGLLMDDSFTAYSEREDFKRIFKYMPDQVIKKVKTEFGEDMVAPAMKKMTEYFVRVWGGSVIDVYDQIDKNVEKFVKTKKRGYELWGIALKGCDDVSVGFKNDKNLNDYEKNFKLDNLGWGHPATMRLSEWRFNYNIDGLYPLIDPEAKKPYYGGDVRRDRCIRLKKESNRFDGLREELLKKMDFFTVVLNGVLDQYFLEGREKLSDINWDRVSGNSKLLLTDGNKEKS